jgi:hypothetical protein
MDISVFTDKENIPTQNELKVALGCNFQLWNEIRQYVLEKYQYTIEEWNFSGVKYGWSFRMKDKKRTILYFLPREKYFKIAFVFGQKASDAIMETKVAAEIKSELQLAKVYAEGRGIRLSVKDERILADIKTLIDIKLLS